MQTLTFPCPFCGRKMGVGLELAGRHVRCPHCRQVTVAPSAAPQPAPAPAAAPAPPPVAAVPPPQPVYAPPPPPPPAYVPPPPAFAGHEVTEPVFNIPKKQEAADSILSDPDDGGDSVFGSPKDVRRPVMPPPAPRPPDVTADFPIAPPPKPAAPPSPGWQETDRPLPSTVRTEISPAAMLAPPETPAPRGEENLFADLAGTPAVPPPAAPPPAPAPRSAYPPPAPPQPAFDDLDTNEPEDPFDPPAPPRPAAAAPPPYLPPPYAPAPQPYAPAPQPYAPPPPPPFLAPPPPAAPPNPWANAAPSAPPSLLPGATGAPGNPWSSLDAPAVRPPAPSTFVPPPPPQPAYVPPTPYAPQPYAPQPYVPAQAPVTGPMGAPAPAPVPAPAPAPPPARGAAPGGGSGVGKLILIAGLGGYALLATLLAAYGFIFRSGGSADPGHPMYNVPDILGQNDPAARKKVGQYKFDLTKDLPASQRVALRQKIPFGALEVQPLSVGYGMPKVFHVTDGAPFPAPKAAALGYQVLVLRLQITNTSPDLAFCPTDPAFNRKAERTDRNLDAIGTRVVIPSGPNAIGGPFGWPFKPATGGKILRQMIEGQEDDDRPLRPGESREYVICSTDAVKNLADAAQKTKATITWRVQLRRGLTEYRGRDVPVTGVVGVEFKAADVKQLN